MMQIWRGDCSIWLRADAGLGREELDAGEGWNSNSLTAWLIARCGLAAESLHAPRSGRAPGWHAGLVVAARCRL
jgi:hypothetical protein